MAEQLLRLYGPAECGPDSYPVAWHYGYATEGYVEEAPIKGLIRELADHRCERCGHPYPPGIAESYPRGEWTPCDEQCAHVGPWRSAAPDGVMSTWQPDNAEQAALRMAEGWGVWAQWRILTVHHLNGVKWDCRWWNLAALCQRCHLTIQGKVVMQRVYPLEHTDWFKPHAAGWYAADYLGEDLTREQTLARLDELLALEQQVTSPRTSVTL